MDISASIFSIYNFPLNVLRYRYILNWIYFRANHTLFRLAIYNKIVLNFIREFNNVKISRKMDYISEVEISEI